MALFFFHRLVTTSAQTENPARQIALGKISANGTRPGSPALGLAADVREPLSRLLLTRPPGPAGDHLRAGGRRGYLARNRPRPRDREHRAALPGGHRHLDAHGVLAPPAPVPLGAEVPWRRSPPLHHAP